MPSPGVVTPCAFCLVLSTASVESVEVTVSTMYSNPELLVDVFPCSCGVHMPCRSTGVMGMAKLRKHLIRAEAMELGDPQDLQLWIQTTQTLWDDTHAAYLSFLKGA